MTNEHPQKKAFMAALAAAEKEVPDQPCLFIAASVVVEGDMYDFPCAIGGRNLVELDKADGTALVSAVIRSVFEMCKEMSGHSKEKGERMFEAALNESFILNIDEMSHESGQETGNLKPDIEYGFLKHIKDSLEE